MLKVCNGWHTNKDGKQEWRQWYTYENEPCPEHGHTQMQRAKQQ